MTIIKIGKTPKTTERFTCPNCGCVFECDVSECNVTFSQKNGNHADVVCPTCGKRVYKDLIVKGENND